MTALPLLLVIQVISCYSADGILTFEPTEAPSAYRTNKEASPHWQTILKSAMFRTISKYTGFSPSLDVKMEADGLLWQKIDGAKYTHKIHKPGEEEERLKTGVLIDLSRENGHLEFRQVDRSLYRSVPQDHRLLALWRMRMVEPNHFLIQIKIPEENPPEYLYEYNLEKGLQEINIKDWEYNRSKHNKNGTWKSGDRKVYSTPSEVYTERNKHPKSLSYDGLKRQKYNGNRYDSQDQLPHRYRKITQARTYLNKPAAQYYTLVGYQTPPPPPPTAPQYTAWLPQNDYYTSNPTTSLPEFKQESDYNGFVPSLGPTGNLPLYQENLNSPQVITYKHTVSYFPSYVPEIQTTQKPFPVTYFKPSSQFIQYSEIDPFYSSNETYDYNTPTPTEPVLRENVVEYPQFIFNTQPVSAISVEIPPVAPGISLYDIAINSIKNDNKSTESLPVENVPQPTVTTLMFDYIQQTDSYNDTESIEDPKPTTEVQYATTGSDISKTRVKNSLRNSQRITNIGDSYDYAPLYIQWGEKIKPSRNKIRTTTPKSNEDEYITTEYQTEKIPESKNTEEPDDINTESNEKEDSTEINEKENTTEIPEAKQPILKPSERLHNIQKQRHSFKIQKQQAQKLNYTGNIQNRSSENNNNLKTPLNNGALRKNENYSDIIEKNITLKSPEEVVRDLTSLGLRNTTNHQTRENLQNESTKKSATNEKDIDSQLESTEPVSVVVNRISQSFSYKTSVGHTGNLQQLPDKT